MSKKSRSRKTRKNIIQRDLSPKMRLNLLNNKVFNVSVVTENPIRRQLNANKSFQRLQHTAEVINRPIEKIRAIKSVADPRNIPKHIKQKL